jgi:hypothetical protein
MRVMKLYLIIFLIIGFIEWSYQKSRNRRGTYEVDQSRNENNSVHNG